MHTAPAAQASPEDTQEGWHKLYGQKMEMQRSLRGRFSSDHL